MHHYLKNKIMINPHLQWNWLFYWSLWCYFFYLHKFVLWTTLNLGLINGKAKLSILFKKHLNTDLFSPSYFHWADFFDILNVLLLWGLYSRREIPWLLSTFRKIADDDWHFYATKQLSKLTWICKKAKSVNMYQLYWEGECIQTFWGAHENKNQSIIFSWWNNKRYCERSWKPVYKEETSKGINFTHISQRHCINYYYCKTSVNMKFKTWFTVGLPAIFYDLQSKCSCLLMSTKHVYLGIRV